MQRNGEKGQALVFTALALTVLLGFAGLGIDMGVLRYQRRLEQSAADAAAIAGASNKCPGCSGIETAADNAAAANGFAATSGYDEVSDCEASTAAIGATCVDVDYSTGPDSGPHAGDANYVQVRIVKVQPTYFMRVFGVNREVIAARAVAGYLDSGGGCLFTGASPSAPTNGININGNGTISANCAIVDNGDFDTQGKSLSVSASSFSVTGSRSSTGGTLTCTATPKACPQTNAPAGADPLSYLTPPTEGTPATFNCNNIQPGTYSGINFSSSCVSGGGNGNGHGNGNGNGGGSSCGTSSSPCVFPSGTYIIDGGGGSSQNFSVGSNVYIQGSGVTFYFTNGATFTATGTPDIQFSAPTSGNYPGILFYQDPNDTASPTLGGDTSSYYQGALYFPSAQLTFYGNDSFNSSASYTVVDAAAVSLSGNPTVNLQSSPSSFPGTANLGKTATLVE